MSDITKIREWVDSEEAEPEGGWDWPTPPVNVESLISGDLRARILAKLGRADDGCEVKLAETEIEGGYSEFTVDYDYEIAVWIGAERVWRYDLAFSAEDSMAAFLRWVA
jgi:hypothetical protein